MNSNIPRHFFPQYYRWSLTSVIRPLLTSSARLCQQMFTKSNWCMPHPRRLSFLRHVQILILIRQIGNCISLTHILIKTTFSWQITVFLKSLRHLFWRNSQREISRLNMFLKLPVFNRFPVLRWFPSSLYRQNISYPLENRVFWKRLVTSLDICNLSSWFGGTESYLILNISWSPWKPSHTQRINRVSIKNKRTSSLSCFT